MTRSDGSTPLRADDLQDWLTRVGVRAATAQADACAYAPVIHDVCRKYFPAEWSAPVTQRQVGGKLKKTVKVYPPLQHQRPRPIFVVFVTGGDCADPADTTNAIRRASHLPIFFQFAGISATGNARTPTFGFLKTLDRLTERHVDNCGFFEASDVSDVEALFKGLLNEFPDYTAMPQVRAMLLPPPEEAQPAPAAPVAVVTDLLAPDPAEEARQEAQRQARQRRRRMRRIEARRAAGEPLDADDIAVLVNALSATSDDDDDTVQTSTAVPEVPEDAVERLRRIRARREARRLLERDD